MKIAVIGNGVIGLSLSLELLKRGHQVSVYAATPYSESTSFVAGALWYPSKMEPQEKVRSWALDSLEEFKSLAKKTETGVSILPIRRWFHRRMGRPWWAEKVDDFKLLYPQDCEGARCGYLFKAPVIDMPVYLNWMQNEMSAAGATFHSVKISNRSQRFAAQDIYVNCTGIGAKQFCGDTELEPVRGISLIGRMNEPIPEAFLDWDDPQGISYIVPRISEVVLGGSEEREPYPDVSPTAKNILSRCIARNSALQKIESYKTQVGYRPFRSKVRVERDTDFPNWIHNYGHGGSGVTLSWGCAREVAKLIEPF